MIPFAGMSQYSDGKQLSRGQKYLHPSSPTALVSCLRRLQRQFEINSTMNRTNIFDPSSFWPLQQSDFKNAELLASRRKKSTPLISSQVALLLIDTHDTPGELEIYFGDWS